MSPPWSRARPSATWVRALGRPGRPRWPGWPGWGGGCAQLAGRQAPACAAPCLPHAWLAPHTCCRDGLHPAAAPPDPEGEHAPPHHHIVVLFVSLARLLGCLRARTPTRHAHPPARLPAWPAPAPGLLRRWLILRRIKRSSSSSRQLRSSVHSPPSARRSPLPAHRHRSCHLPAAPHPRTKLELDLPRRPCLPSPPPFSAPYANQMPEIGKDGETQSEELTANGKPAVGFGAM